MLQTTMAPLVTILPTDSPAADPAADVATAARISHARPAPTTPARSAIDRSAPSLLTAEEEIELARAWRDQQSQEARNCLVERNLALVHSIARGFDPRGDIYEDLYAEGALALMRAANNFDPDAGCRFSTFAFQHVRHAMLGLLGAKSPRNKLPREVRRYVKAWDAAVATLSAQIGRPPTDEEVAEHLEWDEATVRKARSAAGTAANLSHSRSVDAEPDILPDADDQLESVGDDESRASLKRRVAELFSHLTPKEREVMELLYGISVPRRVGREAAASILGCPATTVKHLQIAAERKLRRHWREASSLVEPDAGR